MVSPPGASRFAQDDSGDGEEWNQYPPKSSNSCICGHCGGDFEKISAKGEDRQAGGVEHTDGLFDPLSRFRVSDLNSYSDVAILSTEDNSSLSTLPVDVKTHIVELLPYEDVFKLKLLSKSWKSLIENPQILHSMPSRQNPKLTACYLFVENGDLHFAGFDPKYSSTSQSTSSETGTWRRLPPLSFLPSDCRPDPELFKQFLMATNSGLVCMNLSKSTSKERLIAFNPLTQHWKELPPLLHRRNPVLIHLLVNPATQSYQTQSYQVLVAGSSDKDSLSRITELYDSRTGKWERVGDLPGPAFAVNEYQSGVYRNGNIFCLGFVEISGEVVRGILGYDVAERVWSTSWTERAFPNSAVLQLVENCGELYLFSEREDGGVIEHWVDLIEWRVDKEGDEGEEEKIRVVLRNVLKKGKVGGRSLEMYPEFVLVPYDGARRLCIYNTVEHAGEVVDVEDQEVCGALVELPDGKGFRGGLGFFTLKPLSFVFEPKFDAKV